MTPRTPLLPGLAALASLVLAGTAPAAAPGGPVDYARDIRPILSKNCFACHGPDAGTRASKLRLDLRDSAVAKPKRGDAAILPGNPDAGELVRRILSSDDADRMPPPETKTRVPPEHVALLKQWVKEGAPYTEHWAFKKPVRPALPTVRNPAWCRTGLDAFVLSRLDREGLRPAPEADRFTLLRRASLDLRGLPPTPAEVDEFARDTSPEAYEKAVDRFLKDSAYGERMARPWLDLARYADSAGYGSDPLRTIWRYRDWVIDAFNRNLPHDQFTTEQIAGDLLPGATPEQRVATAFHRNTMTNTEGGTDDEEFRVAAIKDRIDTTVQVWMGLTMGCAKCHSHKYDPVTIKEYYQFYALFNQTQDADRPDESPTLAVPTRAQEEESRRIEARLAGLRQKLEAPSPELSAAEAAWEATLQPRSAWVPLSVAAAKSSGGATLSPRSDGSVRAEGPNTPADVYTLTARTDLKGPTAFRLEVLPDPSLPAGAAGRGPAGRFLLKQVSVTAEPEGVPASPTARFVRVELTGPGDGKFLSLAEVQVLSGGDNVARKGQASQSSTDYDGPAALAIDGNTDGNFQAKSTTHTAAETAPWWEVRLAEPRPIDHVIVWNRTDGGVGSRLANFRVSLLDDARKVVWQQTVAEPPSPKRELSPGGKQAVALSSALADLSQDGFPAPGLVSTNGKGWSVGANQKAPHAAVLVAAAPVAVAPARLTFRLEHAGKEGLNLGRFRLSATNDPQLLQRAAVPAAVLAALDTPAAQRSKEQQDLLARHYRTLAPVLQGVRDEVAKLEASRPKPATVPVMAELPPNQRRTTHILTKGNFLAPGDKVDPAVLSAFHPFPADAPRDRLGVAKWLMSPDNPLTARVAVNRLWAQLWGAGIVASEEDFGTQGELPTHPELLDWLATEYPRLGWDTRAMLRLLVTSAAYRQSSRVTPEVLAKDPANRLFSRGPRFRLEAETVRDQALALSGLLSRKVGGPSVFPYQPPGLWQAAFNGERTWATSPGTDKYRRGLYTFWRRTVPYPSMATFDAPSRETCTVRRVRTNTPLQAFVTLNDPVYVELAQALARRMVAEGGSTPQDRVRFGLRLCLTRPEIPAEQVQGLVELFTSERAHYARDPKAALALATDPLGPLPQGQDPAEMAAWTVVANVLLNLDAVLTKG